MYKIENQLKFEDFIFPYGKLNENNRWIKLLKIVNLHDPLDGKKPRI